MRYLLVLCLGLAIGGYANNIYNQKVLRMEEPCRLVHQDILTADEVRILPDEVVIPAERIEKRLELPKPTPSVLVRGTKALTLDKLEANPIVVPSEVYVEEKKSLSPRERSWTR